MKDIVYLLYHGGQTPPHDGSPNEKDWREIGNKALPRNCKFSRKQELSITQFQMCWTLQQQ